MEPPLHREENISTLFWFFKGKRKHLSVRTPRFFDLLT